MVHQKDQHFLYLDGMRGVAAIMVGILHATQIVTPLRYIMPNAHLAVDFFFCLSGFVVAYAYGNRLGNDMTTAGFLVRRAIRLGPVLLVGLILGAVVFLLRALSVHEDINTAIVVAALSFAMIPAGIFYGLQAFPTNNPVWSLFFELIANILYAFSKKLNWKRDIFIIAFFAITLSLFDYHFGSVDRLGVETPLAFIGGFPRVAYPFFFGVAIYRLNLWVNRKEIWSLLVIFMLPILLGWPEATWKSEIFIIISVIPVFVIAGTAKSNQKISPFLSLLGELSYPFYVIHQPILRAFARIHGAKGIASHYPVITISFILVVISLISLALSRCYDIKVRRYLASKFLNRA